MQNIYNLVEPKSVAIIGASTDSSKIGYQILNNLISGGFKGDIFPVNPNHSEILGLKSYPAVSAIKQLVDLAIIVLPAKLVLTVLRQCSDSKTKSVVVISAGFAESGEAGQKMQDEIAVLCKKSNITLLGPNCLGIINTKANLNASFAQSMPQSGNISLLSQSGAMVTALIDWSVGSSAGFNKMFSMGNKADLNEAKILDYLYNDKTTEVIVAYLETLSASSELSRTLEKYAKKKPTIVIFGGKSSSGAKAASSHTGSIVTSYLAIETYLKQAGVIVASNLSELFIYCKTFSKYRSLKSGGVGIITNAGGPGILACDALENKKILLAKPGKKTSLLLAKKCRTCANLENPIDILGDATEEDYGNALEILNSDPNFNSIIVLVTPQSSTNVMETAAVIANAKSQKPVLSAFIGGDNLDPARKYIESAEKLCFSSPEDAVTALSGLSNFANNNNVELTSALPKSSRIFCDSDRTAALKKFKLPVLEYTEAHTFEHLSEIAKRLGFPVVLKTAKPEISHKTEAGAVVLNIKDEDELKKAFSKLNSSAIIGKMINSDLELFLGIKKDPDAGTVIAFGTGGIYSEIYKDLSYRIAPINRKTALEMIFETKIGQVLDGARGKHKFNLSKLADIIIDSARFADFYSNISEIDFNPVIAKFPDYYIVDVRIIKASE